MKRANGAWASSRATPRRSPSAVETMSTRESGSSTQSTGDLVDPQAATLGEDEQLGVEEPPVVLDLGQQRPGSVGADRLEATLGVGEARAQGQAQQPVVGARDELALGTALHARSACQARSDRDVAMARDEARDQRQQRAQVGREIDVHVAEDVRVAARPRRAQRPAAALGREVQDARARELERECPRDRVCGVGARVVGDHDPPRERDVRREERVQATDRALEPGLLVVDGHDDVDQRVRRCSGNCGGPVGIGDGW